MKRRTIILLFLVLVIAACFFFLTSGLQRFQHQAHAAAGELELETRSMGFWVEATGMLRATSVQNFGAPPAFSNYWQFQIVSMVPDGNNVKKGDVLISFEAQKVRDDLQRFQNELDQATKELDKTEVRIDLERQDLLWKLAAAENNYEKFKLRQGISEEIEASSKIEVDALALEQARREYEAVKERIEWHKRSSDATYRMIASKKARAENKVNQITTGIERFQAKADRDGVIVYKLKWNGEKFRVGENAWSGMPVLEIPDLNTIIAEGFVPEVDLGRVRIGQRAEVTVDAFPGRTYTGKIQSLGTLVRPKAWDIPNKVLDVQIALDRLDTSIMRPAMSIRTRIETSAISDCIAIPLKSVRVTGEGARVKLKTEAGWKDLEVKLGASNGSDVVVREGLKIGDRIAIDYSKTQ